MKCNIKPKFNEWSSKGIRISRDVLYSLYNEKSMISDQSFHNYVRNYSKIFKKVCSQAKSKLISNKIANSDNKIKTVWKIINTETGQMKKRDTELSLKMNNKTISDKVEVANALDHFFITMPIEVTKSLASSPSLAESILKQNFCRDIPNFDFQFINIVTITKTFKSLSLKKTEDLWGISVKVLGSIIDNIAPLLVNIFNLCVDSGTFPDLMKHSKVIPIFKSGCKDNPSNYRPISVLPALSKIFEKIMLDQMMSHFSLNKILHERQFGFTKGMSTTDASVKLVTHILEAWDSSRDAVGIFCDLSKAFDCVDHNTLICKLKHYGIRGRALDLVLSYLTSRLQKVYINGSTSTGTMVKMGVPQGSILGPFLFLAYINDLPYMMTELSDIILFADDTSLIFKINRKDAELVDVNDSLATLSNWFAANNLLLNATKTKCLKFSLPNIPHVNSKIILEGGNLDFVDKTVFLGITIDSKLQWGAHITALSNRLSSAAYAVRRIRQLTDVATARLVYFAYFHSIMSYGILLWGAAADVDSIFILQKRAIRAIYDMGPRESLRDIFKDINILTMPSLYIFENIMYARKNLHKFDVLSDIHNINTRNKHKLVVPKFRLAKSNKSFLGNCVRFYNKLPKSVTDLTGRKFKTFVKSMLIKKAYYKIKDYIDDRDAWR